MISPISPEPRITIFFPGINPSTLTNRCAVPAVYIPAGLVPGMFSAPRVLSRHPIARMTAFAFILSNPSSELTAEIILSCEISNTIVFSFTSIPSSSTCRMNLSAYSGPVSSSLNNCSPKPLWTHCCNMPPSARSRSSMTIFLIPLRNASIAAAIPAGPPPITAMSTSFTPGPPLFCRQAARSRFPFLLLFPLGCSVPATGSR